MKVQKELRIGVFVLLVLVTSFFVINYLRGKDLFGREIEVVACFDDLQGLKTSAPVYIKGYKAGKVMEIEYQEEHGNFMVTCSVVKDFDIPDFNGMLMKYTDGSMDSYELKVRYVCPECLKSAN